MASYRQPKRINAVSITPSASARPIHAQIVWNSLSWISFTRVQTASATERHAVTTAVGQPRIAGDQPHRLGVDLEPLGIGQHEDLEQPGRILGEPVVAGHRDLAAEHAVTLEVARLRAEAGQEPARLLLGELLVELLEAEAPDSPIGRFVEKRGPGIHHICFAVDDLDATLERCRSAGIRLIDETPRIGADKKRIAFLHPSSTGGVLVELSEY